MDLSIIIVNWNSRDYLAKALDSIAESPPSVTHEIVVIDSGSFDGCAEMLRTSHPEVRFLQSPSNLGFARANNAAFKATSGQLLLFLNPDTEVVGPAIDRLCTAVTATPDAGIVGPRLLNSDGSVQDTCVRAFPTVLNQVLDSNLLRTRFPQSTLWGKRGLSTPGDAPFRVDAVSGACLLMKRSLFEAVGQFSTDYFMYAEDMDLCLKATRAGFACYHVPTAVVVHHGGGSSAQSTTSTFAAVMALESQWRYFHKMRSPAYAGLYRAAMLFASLLRVAILLLCWPFAALLRRGRAGRAALRKWAARLRWTLGGERWVRHV